MVYPKGKKNSKETIAKRILSRSWYKHHSKETILKMRNSALGRDMSNLPHPKGWHQTEKSKGLIREKSIQPKNLLMVKGWIKFHKGKNYEKQYGEIRALEIKQLQRIARLKWWENHRLKKNLVVK